VVRSCSTTTQQLTTEVGFGAYVRFSFVVNISGQVGQPVTSEGQNMGERQNTILCVFDPKSPRISAYQIHEWIYEQLKLREQDIRMIQVDGPWRRVYIKFCDYERMQAVTRALPGQMEYRHDNDALYLVQIKIAGMGVRRIGVAGLPPEISDRTLRT
jgi:hypothetical protein